MVHLKVLNLTCSRYPRQLLKGVNFTLNAGESLAFVGENGIGKSSLLRILAGLAAPESGDIHYNGTKAYLGHQQGLQKMLTPVENLNYTMMLHGVRPEAETIEACLSQVGLPRKTWHRSARQLSAGQSRRLAFAKLLIQGAKLWLLDEPFAALDTQGRAIFQKIMQQHLADGGMCILTAHAPVAMCSKQLELAAYAKA